MLTADLTGNFGNHMFQYAVTRACAENHGWEWGFNKNPTHDYFGGKEQMDFLDIDYGIPVQGITQEYPEKIEYIDYGGEHLPICQHATWRGLQDNTKLVGGWQSEAYLNKDSCKQWFKMRRDTNLGTDENTCVINIRGGEYKYHPQLLLQKEYYRDCMNYMHELGVTDFLCITDDVELAQTQLPPEIPCRHYSIEQDYYLILQARYLILSNSSFAWFPAWMNERAVSIIAPMYWSRHNVSDGFWTPGNILVKDWNYMGRDGKSYNHFMCTDKLKQSKYEGLYENL